MLMQSYIVISFNFVQVDKYVIHSIKWIFYFNITVLCCFFILKFCIVLISVALNYEYL